MTVIAYDGKTLAADGRMSCSSSITTDKTNKIYTFENEIDYGADKLLAIAFAGSVSDKYKVLDRIRQGVFFCNEDGVEHETNALLIGRKYVYELEPDHCHLIKFNKNTKIAIGSGHKYARAGLEMGLSSVEAVKLAIKLDSSCGGRITTFSRG